MTRSARTDLRAGRLAGAASIALAIIVALGWTIVSLRGQSRTAAGAGEPAMAALRASFENPPDDSRIMMRWWWFGPAVTRSGLERELRTMKAGGIGGVEIQPVYPLALDDEAAGIVTHPYLSEAFLEDLRFAAGTARGLGMRVDLTLGSGWPYGGPQVKIADAAGKLRVERVVVPARATRVAVPDIRGGERLIAAFLAPTAPATDPGNVREVTDIADGVLRLGSASTEQREVLFFVSSRSGMMVKRPSVGAEGFVLNHYDRDALNRYLASVGRPLLSAFGQDPPDSVFCDSLEVYDSDWTPDFLDEFKSRRGYDLQPLLPALVMEGPDSAGLRHDWAQTLTELLRDRFVNPMQEWSRERGARFRIQGYGLPPAILSTNADVDLPEGEGSQWKTVRASRWAASIGHLYGRPVISSETWTWLHSPVFRATPLDVKAEADLHFLQGINQLIGHGWPYTADGVAYPGWRFYAAGVFNDKNPWWIVMPDLALYLQRVSFLLRQGQPVNDVAICLPADDAWAHFVPGKIASMIDSMNARVGPDLLPAVLGAGFNVDFVDDGVLAGRARVEQGAIAIGANRYRAIILPGIERIPPETMKMLEGFAGQGVQVIATRRTPALAPGYTAKSSDHAAVVEAASRLFRRSGAPGTFVAREEELGAALKSRLQPDFEAAGGASDLGVVHRRTLAADIYFVANTSNVTIATTATFRSNAASAERWDPTTGRTTPVAVTRVPGAKAPREAAAALRIDLAPYESTIVILPVAPASVGQASRLPDQASRLPDQASRLPDQASRLPARGSLPAKALPSVDLSSRWSVRLGDGPVEAWDGLHSWTDDERTRYFSGVVTYEKQVEVPATLLRPGRRLALDFGLPKPLAVGGPNARVQAWLEAPVREAVVVTVNGKRAGSVWCPPYSIDVTQLLRLGANSLRLDVANLAINHMAGHALPDYKLLNLRYGSRFDPQDMDLVQPVPAGLLGPIRLVASEAPTAGSHSRSGRRE